MIKTTRVLLAVLAAVALVACAPVSANNGGKTDKTQNTSEENTGDNTQEQHQPEQPVNTDPFWFEKNIDTGGLVKISFTEDKSNIQNPERGFYYPFSWQGTEIAYLENYYKTQLATFRAQGYRIFLFEFWLTSFMNGDISEKFLSGINSLLGYARDAGAKPILRFGYKHSSENEPKPWDAEIDIVLRHIEQIKPILQANADVILCVQAGFVGVWGEWYYTDHFNMLPSTDEEYEPRRKVLNALLDALPENRQVQVRTPEFKIKILRLDPTDTLTHETAYQPTAKARVAGHNDCFVANFNDWETFMHDYERPFWNSDTKYTIMGGETCDASNSYSDCSNALKDLADQHWTYLNIAYNGDVLDKWDKGKCMDEVKLRLGYRLVLHETYISPDITTGSKVRTVFKLSNDGFAAPINPRGLEVILVDRDSGEKTVIPVTDENPRFWLAGKRPQFEVDFDAPKAGSYTLYLNLPDPEPTLHDNPYYSIRLANKNTWDSATGYNKITDFDVK